MTRIRTRPDMSLPDALEEGLIAVPDRVLDEKWESELASIFEEEGVVETAENILPVFRRLAFLHIEDRRAVGFNISPKEAKRMAAKMDRAIATLRRSLQSPLLSSPFTAQDLRTAPTMLTRFERAAAHLRRTQHSSDFEHECQVRLAGRFLDVFEARKWRSDTSLMSLMARSLGALLQGVGEVHKRPDLLLKEAEKLRG